ncbi:MAG TPA: hypothetical protein VF715_06745 [Thermoleophilaceae bacterium]
MSTVAFYDNWAPPVKDGQYTVTVAQSLTADTTSVPSAPQAPVSQTFILRGPRFVIDPGDVQRAFPADSSTGVFDEFLPMVVLKGASLPWEREMDVTGEVAPALYPWVALLVFDASELLVPGGGDPPPAGSQQSPTRAAAMSLHEVMNPPAGTLGPSLTLEDDEDPAQIRCNAIEMASATFEGLLGGVDDLRMLAHVREVTTESKESSAAAQTWFSTVIANRFALPPEGGAASRANVAHLVSLEGFDTHLGASGPSVPAGTDRVRMISLHAWAFTTLPDPAENFEQLSLNLISPASDGGSGLLMRIPPPPWAQSVGAPDAATAMAVQRIQDGYTALSYRTQSGGETFGWYRGPFSPVPVTEFMGNAPPGTPANPEAPASASDALIYDQVNGLFDTSYAVAFQTGRSLALASLPFATALLQCRRDSHALLDQLLELMRDPVLSRKLVADGILDSTTGSLTPAGVSDLAALLATGVTPHAMVDALATALIDGIAAQVGVSGGFSAADAQQQPADPPTPAPPNIPAELTALMQDPSVTDLLLQLSGLQTGTPGSGTFEAAILPDLIVEWLAQTALLGGVPFSNLVPDERMLPVESIRFFYVDPNWIDALIDGALSAGIQSSRDSLLTQILRDPLHDAVDEAIVEVRDKLRAVPSGGSAPALGTMAGFVLRSALVEGWPGLEIRAWSNADGVDPMKPLRLDRVAPGVMIAIYPDTPVKVELNEPSEGLVFGMEDKGVGLRYLPGTTGETPGKEGQLLPGPDKKGVWLAPAAIAALRRPGLDLGPIRIARSGGLAAALQALLPGETGTLGPAALAVQMVKVPEQMLFCPKLSGS